MAKKTIYLIRHAATSGNAEKRYIGKSTDEELSEIGLVSVSALLDRLQKHASKNADQEAWIKLDRVVSSPMRRAVQTAEILFDGIHPALIDELAEMDFGYFEGKNYHDLNGDPIYQAWIDSGGTMEIPEGESMESFSARSYDGFLKALGDPDRDETIAIVCHGGNIMAILSHLTGGDFYDYMTDNLSGYRLELETSDEGIVVISHHKLGDWNSP